jgi:hypothetical protein
MKLEFSHIFSIGILIILIILFVISAYSLNTFKIEILPWHDYFLDKKTAIPKHLYTYSIKLNNTKTMR